VVEEEEEEKLAETRFLFCLLHVSSGSFELLCILCDYYNGFQYTRDIVQAHYPCISRFLHLSSNYPPSLVSL